MKQIRHHITTALASLTLLTGLIIPAGCSFQKASAGIDSDADGTDTIAAAPLPRKAVLIFAGDAMQHKSQLESARRADGSYDYSGTFDALAPLISEADYAVVNLETTLGEKGFTGYPMFCSPDSYARALKDAGFDLFLTSNNHCLDRRDKGLRRTIDVLDSLGVAHTGTYRNRADRDSLSPLIADINGFKVAFLNYTYGTNGIAIQGDAVVNYIDRDLMKRDIALARERGAEIVCVSTHWGEEYKLLPNSYERTYADFLLAEGVDIVNGGHPHVIQPMQMVADPAGGRDRLVSYSLGNFISGMRTTDTRGGAMLRVTLERDSAGSAYVSQAEYLPVFVEKGVAGQRSHRVVVADSAFNGPQGAQARAFLRNAEAIFDKHNKKVERLR